MCRYADLNGIFFICTSAHLQINLISMDIKQIQDLIRFVSKSGVNEVSIEQKDFKITIKTNEGVVHTVAAAPVAVQHIAAPVAPAAAVGAALPGGGYECRECQLYLRAATELFG